ncbi:adherens junction formation factor afadin isoform X4 [Andrena cerasifolii]|uniref:adherens junction formation factor afadin isoform X4 n=1 Tax=Andrena cerasifolii TaxID=2819439 RepID=UPI004038480F
MTVSEVMATELANKKAEREALRGVIQQWNANRLDLFELSEPNEELEFHGVMRFYFQDSGQKVATKCIRVASDATSQAVIETLIEKFRPDMRMLSIPEYALYEIHENGEERKLGLDEKPLLVQLNWHIDDREGRFLLRRIDDKTNAQGVGFSSADGSSFHRKLSKREKKQMKKQEKLGRLKGLEQDENAVPVDQNGVAEKLYTELPETSFTRSISNPEAVMSRRRQQKLERKLQQFRSKDGGPDTGGTLKIYGEALCKDVPYKTLLLSVRDSAVQVVREMLSKYGLEKVDPQQYCLMQVNSENMNGGTQQEYILDDDECPLAILMNHPSARGSIMFHVRRRPADYVPRKRKKKPSGKWNELDHRYEDERLPFLLELNPDGSDVPNGAGTRHRLQPNVTEVGSERPVGPQAVQAQTLTLTGSTVMPRHCVIAFTENIVTLTPCSRDAHTYVNNQRIHQTTILQNGAIIKFGRLHTFRFIDPAPDERIRQRPDSGRQFEYGYERRSPDLTSQETNVERYGSTSGTPNCGQSQGHGQAQSQGQGQGQPCQDETSHSSSPTKSTPASAVVWFARSSNQATESTHNYETTFDLDGNVETASLTSSRDGNRTLQNDRQPRGTDPILPAVLEFLEETEETFFHAVITDVEPSAPQFKLAPTYTLYLAARYRASTHYRPELQPTERAHRLTVMLANVAAMIQRVIQERYMDASSLALWLANGSELLHMLKNDRHVGAFSTRAQDILTEAVHTAFASLVRCISLELAPAMSQFMADADEPAKEAGVLQIFSNTMALLRRCRVNAALTIQLFSHLFHMINATAFNALVSNANLCVRWFGRRLKARLNALETWAERQGLEFASQCHLATIMQATHLLQAPKYNAEELATLSSTCFKLNSLQVRALLQKYQPAADEPRLPAELIENVVRVTESVADTLARADGREIRLEEEPTLALALLLPEDGYSCEVIRAVPPGLAEFLAPLQRDGLCRMAPQPTSSGYWTIYMIDHHNNFRSPSAMSNRSGGYSCHTGPNPAQPEIHVIKLHKSTNGMGLSIVAAKGAGQDRLGIYIKSVVAGGAADADGRLTTGDQLLKVDGQSLVGITQEKAAEYLVRTGPIVTLEVAKQGAIYHGLATLLSQPSPIMTRAHKIRPKSEHFEALKVEEAKNEQTSISHSLGNLLSVQRPATDSVAERSIDPVPGPRRMSERDLPSRLGRDTTVPQQQMHTSKSVPALHNVGTEGKQQHEVFNPGYSRASSSNSVTPPVMQPPSMTPINGSTSLRSRSSHNLHDPIRIGTLPPSGLVSRQQSSPNLNPCQTTTSSNGFTATVTGPTNTLAQSNEAERFYQNLSVYRNQDSLTKQRYSPSQHSDERTALQLQKSSRGSQNSLNRPGTFEISQVRDRPMSAYVSQGQQQPYLGGGQSQQQQGNAAPLRSQSSRDIIRQEAKLQEMQEEVRRRELRGGVPVSATQYRPSTYNVKSNLNTTTTTTQSTNSIVRPAKSIGTPSTVGSNTTMTMPMPAISTPGHGTKQQSATSNYGYLDSQCGPYVLQYGKSPPTQAHQHQHQHQPQPQHQPQSQSQPQLQSQPQSQPQPQHQHQHQFQPQPQLQSQHQHHHQNVQQQSHGHVQYSAPQQSRGKTDSTRLQSNGMSLDYGRDQTGGQDYTGRSYATDQTRHFTVGSQYHLNGISDARNDQYAGENGTGRTHTVIEGNVSILANQVAPIRPALPEDGFRDSPPPPPPNTSTHPLYNKQSDSRYTASMQDPPRGGYYPANGTAGTALQPRQYQYSATNPWQREEREKEQARRREAARQWRDQQIAELSALPHRTSQQEEQLRALQLERDFQKRAEEAANQQDDDEENNDADAEHMQRVQGLLRTTTSQDRSHFTEQHNPNLSRLNIANQSVRVNHAVHSIGGSMHSTTVVAPHSSATQQSSQNLVNICPSQSDKSGSQLSQTVQHDQTAQMQMQMQMQMQNTIGQVSLPSLIHLAASQKSGSLATSQPTDEAEMQRKREDELKRKQLEFDETLKRKEEESKQQQIQQIYQQQHHQHLQQSQSHLKNQQILHPNMLRLEGLVINGPNTSSTQNGNNDAPLPPERGSSYAVMSQQGALRSNNANTSNILSVTHPQQSASIKRVSFHDTNANPESTQRNFTSGNLNTTASVPMDIIAEDPNNFINDAESLLASPKTPEGSGIPITGSTPGVIGAQEVYKDPRQRRLAEKQKQQQNSQVGPVPEKLSFKEKMKMFAMETGEDGTPRDKTRDTTTALMRSFDRTCAD